MKQCLTPLVIHQGNANQAHEIPLHTRMAIIKKADKNKCWQLHGKVGTLYTASGNVKWCSLFRQQSGRSSKVKESYCYHPEIPCLGVYIQEKICSFKNLHKNNHSSIIHNSQEQPKC